MPCAMIDWTLVAKDLSIYDSSMLLESFEDYVVNKSGITSCSLFSEPTPHNMRTRLLLCKCKVWKTPMEGKVQICILSNLVNLWEVNHHGSPLRPPREAFARDMCTYNHNYDIYDGIVRRFLVADGAMPKLTTVQRFVQHYRRAHLGWAITTMMPPRRTGGSIVGRGSDADTFAVGQLSKLLLRRLDRDPATYVLHLDATYILSQVKYPIIVVSISECMNPFHLVKFFILSQQTEHHFTEALAMLRRIYTLVTNKQLSVRYIMADADKTQRNVVGSVLGVDNDLVNLMRYFHVAAKHYATSEAELELTKARCLESWDKLPQLSAFAIYFSVTELEVPSLTDLPNDTRFWCYNQSSALSSAITHCVLASNGHTIVQLLLRVKTEGVQGRPVATEIQSRPDMVQRVREMTKVKTTREATPIKHSIGFLTGDA
ncbi:LOW QUALITY PROTEIN: hypothetical protein PHMEG_00020200 [Phytophthora megakarya]|uniref:MULE transposase domain-containing protein n=1 Tax=Phytophthora megakarya TaxID=4795 RepID=A0A225VPY4_9STRA|nr:LOW QUALITY PROTEIN: hypothetical protein PHMEG_00020200 [Phytophthora megakarya]